MDDHSAIPLGGHDSKIWLPSVVVKNAKSCPNGLYARTPLGPSYTDGYRDVSNLQYAQAIDHIAHLIESRLGKGVNFETVAYVGPSDIRYNMVIVAGMKAGYKVCLAKVENFLLTDKRSRYSYHRREIVLRLICLYLRDWIVGSWFSRSLQCLASRTLRERTH